MTLLTTAASALPPTHNAPEKEKSAMSRAVSASAFVPTEDTLIEDRLAVLRRAVTGDPKADEELKLLPFIPLPPMLYPKGYPLAFCGAWTPVTDNNQTRADLLIKYSMILIEDHTNISLENLQMLDEIISMKTSSFSEQLIPYIPSLIKILKGGHIEEASKDRRLIKASMSLAYDKDIGINTDILPKTGSQYLTKDQVVSRFASLLLRFHQMVQIEVAGQQP